MRIRFTLLVLPLVLLSCSESAEELQTRLRQTEQERDQLRTALAGFKTEETARQAYIAETTRVLNEVQDSIAQIRRDELGIIRVTVGAGREGVVRASQKQEMLDDIDAIRKALQANRKKLAELEQKAPGPVSPEMNLLRSVVTRLQQTLEEQQRNLAAMELTVRVLRAEIALKDEDIVRKGEIIDQQGQQIVKLEEEARVGYVLVGSVEELQSAGVAEYRRGVLGKKIWQLKKDLDKRRFHKIDTGEVREIPIPAPLRKVLLLSSHPAASYTLEVDGGATLLRIREPQSFWQFDSLVVLIKR